MQLPEVRLISIDQLERATPGLREARQNRSLIEFYFTCTPALPLYILEHWPDVGGTLRLPSLVWEAYTGGAVVVFANLARAEYLKLRDYLGHFV